MDTQTSEIAEGIYRFSTFVPDIGRPASPSTNTSSTTSSRCCSIPDIEPPSRSSPRPSPRSPRSAGSAGSPSAMSKRRVRGHEPAARRSAQAEVAMGARLHGVAERPGRPAARAARRRPSPPARRAPGEAYRHATCPAWLGGQVLYEETTSTLLCGTSSPSWATARRSRRRHYRRRRQAEDAFRASCLTPDTGPTIRRLADLNPHARRHARLLLHRRRASRATSTRGGLRPASMFPSRTSDHPPPSSMAS